MTSTSGTLEGIDVSRWNGPVQWAKVRDAGKRFAYIKIDDRMAEHLSGANNVGLLTGLYQALTPGQPYDMDPFAKAPTDLTGVCDLEVTGGLDTRGIALALNRWAGEYETRFGRAGWIYGSPGFLAPIGRLLQPSDPAYRMLPWFAAYGAAKAPTVAPWGRALVWQHSGNTCYADGSYGPKPKTPGSRIIAAPGRCPGVIGECDLNTYEGTYDDFKVLHGLRVAPLPDGP